MRATPAEDAPASAQDPHAATPRSVGQPHRRDIQGLRAVAVLLVVAFHAGLPVSGGFTGVDVFFVVSGFVITGLLTRELNARGEIDLRAFYSRRVRRLLPALAVLLVVVCVAGAVLLSPLGPQGASRSAAISAAAFVANFHFAGAHLGYFDPTIATNPLLHTWSLSVEEQFYLVFPALLAWAWVHHPSSDDGGLQRRAIGIVALVSVASFALSVATTNGATFRKFLSYPTQFAFYSSPTRAWEFGVGALIALVVPGYARRLHPAAGVACGFAGAALIAIAARAISSSTAFPGTAALIPVAGAALVVIGGATATGGVTRLLSTSPLVWIGDRSYGWYLWHWPLIVFATIVWPAHPWAPRIAAVASLVPTYLSYRLVETPLRFNRSLVGRRALTLAGVCVAVPVAIGLALGVPGHAQSHTGTARQIKQFARHHADVVGYCDTGTSLAKPKRVDCTWRPAATSKGDVYLVGDSNAGQFTEPVAQATTRLGYSFTVATKNACPFVDIVVRNAGQPIKNCHAFVTQTITELARRHPSLVIIASSSTNYVDENRFVFVDPDTHERVRTTAGRERLWREGLTLVLSRLHAAGVPAIVVHTIPHFGNWDLVSCPEFRMARGLTSCGTSRDRVAVAADQSAALTAERAAVAAVPGTRDADFTAALCSPTTCATNTGSFFMFRDYAHLSVDGALRLEPAFERLLRPSLPR